MIWTYHHVLMDGWSAARLIEEILACYMGMPQQNRAAQFRAYLGWLRAQDQRSLERFWRARRSTFEAPTLLATATIAPDAGAGHGQVVSCLDAAETAAVQRLAQREHVTMNTLVQAAWVLILQRYTGQRSVTFGATVSGRSAAIPGIDGMLGLFINTLPVIQSPSPNDPLNEWLRQLQAANVELREYEHSPLYEVQRWLGHGGQSLFDTLLVFENYPIDQALRRQSSEQLRFDPVEAFERTNYALTLEATAEEQLRIVYTFACAEFEESQVHCFARQVNHLLRSFVAAPAQKLGMFSLLDGTEVARASVRARGQSRAYAERCLHELFEEQVERSPYAVAVSSGAGQISYAELNARSNQLARRFRTWGVGPDVLVGVCLERSVNMVVALLAILKAGGAYLALDPDHPAERLAYFIEDSGIKLLVSDEPSARSLPETAVQRMLM
ncbi:MAG TPA: condensation domain-containing protein, partial [Polyangiales bacterium]|nr:condensation domain-containing protein [Polyangiales bacterium]